ncbi:MAG: hypothetical protein DCC67_04395 [Planctomycetota bacterium]|nr:MAG: hypothetical protein DCC67_04395 [Planctomycetota bacterium]
MLRFNATGGPAAAAPIGALAAAIALAVAAANVRAEQAVEIAGPDVPAPSAGALPPAPDVADFAYGGYGGYELLDQYDGPVDKPVNWVCGPYLKAGPAGVIGEGILDDPDVAWIASGGYRQPLGPDLGGDRLFFDLGGSYLSAYGETTRGTPGLRVTRDIFGNASASEIVDDAFETQLKEVKRGSAHVALGWFWGDYLDRPANDPQYRIATRLGGRVGHVRGEFEPDVRLINPAGNQTITPIYGKTDTFGGLFVGAEAVFLQRGYTFGNVQWTVEGELANDWIELHHFESSSLGTASLMLGFMLTR